jgi:hypothetical protein
MLRKLLALGVLAAIAGMVIGGASLASADDEPHATTLHLTSRTVSETNLNLGPRAFGPGDQFLFREVLMTPDGERAGILHGQCTNTELNEQAQRVSFRCSATFVFTPRDQIDVQGVVTFSGENDTHPFFLPITGGSGRYIGVEGEVRVHETGARTSDYRLRLID